MSETANLNLPLVEPAQAQKHVTVNEAFGRLDALTQLSVRSRGGTIPPVSAAEGETYIVGNGGVNAWSGRDGQIAIRANGGWDFVAPKEGWGAFVQDEGQRVVWLGGGWRVGVAAASPNGAATGYGILEADFDIPAGGAFTAPMLSPAPSVVFGVTGVVLQTVTGTATAMQVGVTGSPNRYGSGLGMAQGAWIKGLTGQPLTYYSGLAPVITPEGGTFAGGRLRLAIHYLELTRPQL